MRRYGRGLAPHGGILLDEAADAASREAVRQPPAASGEAAPGPATEGGSAIAKPPGGTAEPVAGSGPQGGRPMGSGSQEERAREIEPRSAGHVGEGRAAGTDGGVNAGQNPGRNPAGQASVAVRAGGAVARPDAGKPEPSLARVLATTIQLWVTRRLRRLGIGRRRPTSASAAATGRAPSAPARSRSARRWRLAAIVLAAAILALVAVQLSGVLSKPVSPGQPAANPGNSGASSLAAAAAARNQTAAWVGQQVGSANIVACDPVMCSALLGRGIPAGRLLPLQSAGANPFGADVIVASPSVRGEYGSDLTTLYAPTLLASFGTGAARVDVRAIALQGGAAYRAAEGPDLAARKAAGAQLLHNLRFHATGPAARQITAGQVDERLLVTLASLASQRTVSVGSFGDTGPGAPVEFRQVSITSPGAQGSALTADLDQVRTQRAPYLPDSATIVHPGGPSVLRIEFGAPSPLGLLTGGNSP